MHLRWSLFNFGICDKTSSSHVVYLKGNNFAYYIFSPWYYHCLNIFELTGGGSPTSFGHARLHVKISLVWNGLIYYLFLLFIQNKQEALTPTRKIPTKYTLPIIPTIKKKNYVQRLTFGFHHSNKPKMSLPGHFLLFFYWVKDETILYNLF